MRAKRIELDFIYGMVGNIFKEVCEVALSCQCDDVVFEFNGGKFSVSRSSVWNEHILKKLQTYPRELDEVKL